MRTTCFFIAPYCRVVLLVLLSLSLAGCGLMDFGGGGGGTRGTKTYTVRGKTYRPYLTADGYQVFTAYNGRQAVDILNKEEIHLVLMDIMMPEMNGISAMVKIREKSNVPVILLTAKSEDTDKILGLTVGADDYVTKPFNPVELQARVKSQLRRYMQLGGNTKQERDVLAIGGIELCDRTKEVTLDGEPVSLTRTEYDILKLLMEHPGEVFSPNQIYEQVWRDNPYGTENTVAVHIRHLREKVEYNPAEPRYLKVVWGRGYKMEETV